MGGGGSARLREASYLTLTVTGARIRWGFREAGNEHGTLDGKEFYVLAQLPSVHLPDPNPNPNHNRSSHSSPRHSPP